MDDSPAQKIKVKLRVFHDAAARANLARLRGDAAAAPFESGNALLLPVVGGRPHSAASDAVMMAASRAARTLTGGLRRQSRSDWSAEGSRRGSTGPRNAPRRSRAPAAAFAFDEDFEAEASSDFSGAAGPRDAATEARLSGTGLDADFPRPSHREDRGPSRFESAEPHRSDITPYGRARRPEAPPRVDAGPPSTVTWPPPLDSPPAKGRLAHASPQFAESPRFVESPPPKKAPLQRTSPHFAESPSQAPSYARGDPYDATPQPIEPSQHVQIGLSQLSQQNDSFWAAAELVTAAAEVAVTHGQEPPPDLPPQSNRVAIAHSKRAGAGQTSGPAVTMRRLLLRREPHLLHCKLLLPSRAPRLRCELLCRREPHLLREQRLRRALRLLRNAQRLLRNAILPPSVLVPDAGRGGDDGGAALELAEARYDAAQARAELAAERGANAVLRGVNSDLLESTSGAAALALQRDCARLRVALRAAEDALAEARVRAMDSRIDATERGLSELRSCLLGAQQQQPQQQQHHQQPQPQPQQQHEQQPAPRAAPARPRPTTPQPSLCLSDDDDDDGGGGDWPGPHAARPAPTADLLADFLEPPPPPPRADERIRPPREKSRKRRAPDSDNVAKHAAPAPAARSKRFCSHRAPDYSSAAFDTHIQRGIRNAMRG
ncbi:hypothetical protein M885DRAFT_565256 [Pelagophyceae sp. CCMP2097]|nr:hypothetical protein M885DRAFT_565256 [Pelagophyceae sp. CCMP2097]